MEAEKFLIEEALILVPVLLVIGRLLKQTPVIQDWLIPYLLLVIGIVLSFFVMGYSVDAFIQGILVVGVTVFTHQLIKQTNEANK